MNQMVSGKIGSRRPADTYLKCLLKREYYRLYSEECIQIFTRLQPLVNYPSYSLAHLVPEMIDLLRRSKIPAYQKYLFLDDEETNEIF
jgi:hypothetical protein